MSREDNRRQESTPDEERFQNRPEVQQTVDAQQSDGKGKRFNVANNREDAESEK